MIYIAKIAIDVPLYQLFDYILPDHLLSSALSINDYIGRRIIVPFGQSNRQIVGIILDVYHTDELSQALKSIISIDDFTPALPTDMIKIIQETSTYYHYYVGRIAVLALPSRLRSSKPLSKQITNWIQQQGYQSHLEINYQALYQLHQQQTDAIRGILSTLNSFKVSMLYGVTGSGKTEVYLNVIHEILKQDASFQILLLVPEIILTPQLEDYMLNRFNVNIPNFIVSLHSGLTENERLRNYYLASKGIARIILGTRSAIFTPLPHLKLVIIDEEHDLSYRQQEDFRYSARDIAILRCRAKKIPLLLGSATPSLETWNQVLLNQYQRLDLSYKAIPQPQPTKIHLIDIRPLKIKEGLSDLAIQRIRDTIALDQQILIFINRRGYAPVIYCKSCAWVATCPFCSASRLVIHQKQHKLICHHCGYHEEIKSECPNCHEMDSLVPVGQGTERLEQYLQILFPNEKIIRLDTDHIKKREDWLLIRDQIKSNQVKIIIGTQMATKGHDFKHISTVIVINADSGLYSSDFRSEEYLLGQLMQVIGRCGRNQLPSNVYIQTSFPTHPLFGSLLRQDYLHYALEILNQRQLFNYPPYSKQAIIRAISVNKQQVYDFLQHIYNESIKLFKNQKCSILFDPIPAKMERKAGKTQAYLLIQSPNAQELYKHLVQIKLLILAIKLPYQLQWFIELNPIEF